MSNNWIKIDEDQSNLPELNNKGFCRCYFIAKGRVYRGFYRKDNFFTDDSTPQNIYSKFEVSHYQLIIYPELPKDYYQITDVQINKQ